MNQLAYLVWSLGLVVTGGILYASLLLSMSASETEFPPHLPLFSVFVFYGMTAELFMAGAFKVWSWAHSLGFVAALVVGIPWLLAQGYWWRRTWILSGYHRAVIALCFGYAVLWGLIFGFSSRASGNHHRASRSDWPEIQASAIRAFQSVSRPFADRSGCSHFHRAPRAATPALCSSIPLRLPAAGDSLHCSQPP